RHVLAIDGRRRRVREAAEELDLRGERVPQIANPGSLSDFPRLFVTADGLPERGEMEQANVHLPSLWRCGWAHPPARLTLTDRSVRFLRMARTALAAEAERRLALLKAAFREVAEKGFSEVTLDDIARRAGVSKGVTLYYFDSK